MSTEEETPAWFVVLLVGGLAVVTIAGVFFYLWMSMKY